MTSGIFARASQRVLDKLGEDALLRGEPAGKVNVEHNVELNAGMLGTAEDNYVLRYSVATISGTYAPKVGDLLDHPDGSFKLDRRIDDNGYLQRFIVVRC